MSLTLLCSTPTSACVWHRHSPWEVSQNCSNYDNNDGADMLTLRRADESVLRKNGITPPFQTASLIKVQRTLATGNGLRNVLPFDMICQFPSDTPDHKMPQRRGHSSGRTNACPNTEHIKTHVVGLIAAIIKMQLKS